MAAQRALRQAWLEGVEGRLCGREQAKAGEYEKRVPQEPTGAPQGPPGAPEPVKTWEQTLGGNLPPSDSERGEFLLTFVESLLPVPGGTTPRREPHTLSLIRRGRVFSSNLRDSGPKLSTRGPLGGQHSDPFRCAQNKPRRISICETIFQCIFCVFRITNLGEFATLRELVAC